MLLCSLLLFGYYQLFLKNKTFHHYNRFYLLFAVFFSVLLPFLKVSYFTIELNPKLFLLYSLYTPSAISAQVQSESFNWQWFLALIVILISGFLILKLIIGVAKVLFYKIKFKGEKFQEIHFYETNLEEAPFSFFRNLFWKKSIDLNSEVGKQILKHEMVHIEQKHSWDKMFMEVVASLFWFNPLFYFIKKELYLIHEYLADKKAVKNADTKAFAQMLLASHFSGNAISVTSPFLNSNLKKRLKMLQKPKTKFSYLRRFLALPTVFVLVFAYLVNAKNKEISKVNDFVEKSVSVQQKNDTIKPTVEAKLIEISDAKSVKDDKTFGSMEEKIAAASENALFIVNAEQVSKKEFISFINSNKNAVISTQDRNLNDDEHLVFGEVEKKYGVFQADDVEKMKGNVEKYHQLIKKINPKWYYDQIINNKYGKIEAEKRRKEGKSVNVVEATLVKVNDDNEKPSQNTVSDRVVAKRDYDKNPLSKDEIEELRKEAETMRITAVKQQEERKRMSDRKIVLLSTDKLITVFDDEDRVEKSVPAGNIKKVFVGSPIDAEYFINGKKATIRDVQNLEAQNLKEFKSSNEHIAQIKLYRVKDPSKWYKPITKVEIETKN